MTFEKRPQDWRDKEKLAMVIRCGLISDVEVNQVCCEQGIYANHICRSGLYDRRQVIQKKFGKISYEIAYGITSQTECDVTAIDILRTNRNHWCIKNSCTIP